MIYYNEIQDEKYHIKYEKKLENYFEINKRIVIIINIFKSWSSFKKPSKQKNNMKGMK